jgi:hypothetical protein
MKSTRNLSQQTIGEGSKRYFVIKHVSGFVILNLRVNSTLNILYDVFVLEIKVNFDRSYYKAVIVTNRHKPNQIRWTHFGLCIVADHLV